MNTKTQIQAFLEEELAAEHFVVEINYQERRPKAKLSILLDGDKGINIDECAKVSRALSAFIEENNLIDQAYVLEVSSPGVDTPLKLARQYQQHIGRNLKISLKNGDKQEGKLTEINESQIVLQTKSSKKSKPAETLQIDLENIAKANVLVSFK